MDLTQFGGTEVIVVKGAHGPLEIRGATTRYGVVESLGRVDVCSLNERTSINLREPSEIQVPAGGRLELGDVQGPL